MQYNVRDCTPLNSPKVFIFFFKNILYIQLMPSKKAYTPNGLWFIFGFLSMCMDLWCLQKADVNDIKQNQQNVKWNFFLSV